MGLTSHRLALPKRKERREFKTIGKHVLRKIRGKEAAVNVSQIPWHSSASGSLDPAGNKNFENQSREFPTSERALLRGAWRVQRARLRSSAAAWLWARCKLTITLISQSFWED